MQSPESKPEMVPSAPLPRPPRVLIVDDEATVRRVCQFALKSEGWQADGEGVASVALTRLREGSGYDVVLLDYAMPELDGLQFLQELQEFEVSRRPKVLLASAHADGAVALQALRLGVWDIVAKPLTPDDVRRRIKRLWSREGRAAAGSRPAGALWHATRQEWSLALAALRGDETVFKNLLRGLLYQMKDESGEAALWLGRGLWWTGWENYGPEIWRELAVRLDVDED